MRNAYAGMPPQFEVNSLNPSLMALYQPLLNFVGTDFKSDLGRHEFPRRNPYRQP